MIPSIKKTVSLLYFSIRDTESADYCRSIHQYNIMRFSYLAYTLALWTASRPADADNSGFTSCGTYLVSSGGFSGGVTWCGGSRLQDLSNYRWYDCGRMLWSGM